MPTSLLQNWWLFLLRGLLAVLFGVVAFLAPGLTLTLLVYLFAGYMLADGFFALVAAFRAVERHERWGSLIVEALANIAAAFVIALWPGISELVLVYLVGIWAIVTGVLAIVAAFHMHRLAGEWLFGLGGLLSLMLGIAFFVVPLAGVVAIAWWIGTYAILFGAALIALSLKLRQHPRRTL